MNIFLWGALAGWLFIVLGTFCTMAWALMTGKLA